MVSVRPAGKDDSEAISRLIFEAFSPYRAEFTDGAFEYTAVSPDVVRSRLAEGPIWIAELDQAAVGTVSGMPDGDRFYIRSMAVKPSLQRKGVGQNLLAALEAYARTQAFKKLYLYTTYVLPGGRRLYEKNGFYVLRETLPEEWFGMGGLEMEKVLD